MSIKEDYNRLLDVTKELKRIQDRKKELFKTKNILESRITKFLKEKDLPGVKHDGSEIRLQQKNVRKNKPKPEMNSEIEKLLLTYGIENSKKFIEEYKSITKDTIVKDVVKLNAVKS